MILEPRQVRRAAPAVFTPRKDETLRSCLDYRKLNLEKRPDSYSVHWKNECFDSPGEAPVLFALDTNSGHW